MISILVLANNYRTVHYLMNYAREIFSKYSNHVVVDRVYFEITVYGILIKFMTYAKYDNSDGLRYTKCFHCDEFNNALVELDKNASNMRRTLKKLFPEAWS